MRERKLDGQRTRNKDDTFDNEGIWYGFLIVQMTILLNNKGGSSDFLKRYYINGRPLNKNVNRQETVKTWTVVSRFQIIETRK